MKAKRRLLPIGAGLAACIIAFWFSASIHGGEKNYEVILPAPEYRTDAARAIDAYERTMYRYMDMTERDLTNISIDIRDFSRQLDSIESTLKELSLRMAGIEKALGIEKPKKTTKAAKTPTFKIPPYKQKN